MVVVFFFQAEDGIRDLTVTGVQTCALPISRIWSSLPISVKILGDCIGSICQRIDTSTCIPICSLDRASMASICSPCVGHCSSRVEYLSMTDHGTTRRIPASSGAGSTYPKACRTPTSPGSIDRKSTHLNSSHSQISYAVFCLKKKSIRLAIQTGYLATFEM